MVGSIEATTDASDRTGLRFHDLGPLEIDVDGARTVVRWRKPAQILATLLVSANRPVPVDTLIDVVWGEDATDATVSTLASHIWRLRGLMEPGRPRSDDPTHLVSDRGGYRLVVNPEQADALRFAELAGQGDLLLAGGEPGRALPRYEQALALWRGRPFDPIADRAWAAAPIARLEDLYGQVNEQRVEALLRTGAAETAVPVLEELIAGLPFRERLWRQLMLALYQAGRIEESLGAYARARTSLLEDLGLDPGPELRGLHQRILDQDPTLARQPSVEPDLGAAVRDLVQPRPARPELHLPVRRSLLIGRDAELGRLTTIIGRTRLMTLVGAGGAGKTRVAVEVARAAADLGPDGVWFVDLAAVDDPGSVPDVVMSTVGIVDPAIGTPSDALRSYLRDRQVLLVVDNCEHLLEAVRSLLESVLAEDSQARVIATSREPLGLDGEVLWTLAPLAVLGDAGLDGKGPSPAARLFLARAQGLDATFEPDATSLATVEAICSAVDGLPLAIELAAGRIRGASLVEIRRQVDSRLGTLSRIGYGPTEHHRTVEVSIEWSVRLLDVAERAVHRRLSSLPGAFTVGAAVAVLDKAASSSRDPADLLHGLVHRSLLSVVPSTAVDEPTRFRQLATVRAHAAASLVDSGELGETLRRRQQWVEDLVASRPGFDDADADGWYSRASADHDTITAVLYEVLVDRPDASGVHLLAELSNYWTYQRRMAESERWSLLALEQHDAAVGDLIVVELQLAGSYAYRNRCDLALPLVSSATARAGEADGRVYAHSLAMAAWCGYVRGDPALLFVGDEISRIAGDDPMIGAWAGLLSAVTLLTTRGAAPALESAEALVERAVDAGNLAAAWLGSSLAASAAFRLHDPQTSLSWIRRGVGYQRRCGNVREVGLLELHGNLQAMAGNDTRAAQLFAQSSALMFREGSPWPIRPWTESSMRHVRQKLTVEEFETAWKHGIARANAVGDALPDDLVH